MHPGVPAFDEFFPRLYTMVEGTRVKNLKIYHTLSTVIGDKVKLWDVRGVGERMWANHDENYAACHAYKWGLDSWSTLASTYSPPVGFTSDDLSTMTPSDKELRILNFQTKVLFVLAAEDNAAMELHGNDLASLVRARQDAVVDKLSLATIDRFCAPVLEVFLDYEKLNPLYGVKATLGDVTLSRFKKDILLLREFATKGVTIPVDPFFVANNHPGSRLSDRYMSALPAVNYMWYKSRLENKILFLTLAQAQSNNCHFQDISWAVKKFSVQGRNTTNCSGVSGEQGSQTPLNSKKYVREESIRLYGKIQHPNIIQIAQMILRAELLWGILAVVLWKMDIKGAFPQLPVRPEDAHFMASMMSATIILINYYGSFGLTVFPFAFEVVTRILRVLINFVITGEAKIYVDDAIGVSHKFDFKSDMNKAGEQMQILGSTAEAKNKRFWTHDKDEVTGENIDRTLDVLGWEINLTHRFIDIAKENRLKAIYLFWTTDLDIPAPLETIEAMASLASRYSLIYQELSILVGPLYRTQQPFGVRFKGTTRIFTAEAKVAVKVWRAHFILAEIRSAQGLVRGRNLSTFAPSVDSGWLVEFDGCLLGIGARVLRHAISDSSYPIGCYRDDGCLTNFNIVQANGEPDTSYQNHMELLSLTMGLLSLASIGVHSVAIKIRGDSKSILSWALRGKFHSPFAISASLVLIAICRRFEFTIRETEHLSSEANHLCDARSRGVDPSNMIGFQKARSNCPLRDTGSPYLFGGQYGPTLALINLANPIIFRDTNIGSDDNLMLNHMRSIQIALDTWEHNILLPDHV